MEIRETYRILLAELSEKAEHSADSPKFCEEVVIALKPVIVIDALVLGVRYDESTFDIVSMFNRSYARLDNDRFLKIHRRTPMTEAIRMQTIQAWGNNQKIIREFPESITWAVVPHAVIVVPIVIDNVTEAGCVFALHEEFENSAKVLLSEFFDSIAHLIYQVYRNQQSRFLLL